MRKIFEQRHPKFDETWAKYHKLAWKLATDAAQRYRGDAEDYIGTVVIAFNHLLYHHREGEYQFTTLACFSVPRLLEDVWARFDSEANHRDWRARRGGIRREIHPIELNYPGGEKEPAAHERNADEKIMDELGDRFWEKVTEGLDLQTKKDFLSRYRDGELLHKMAKRKRKNRRHVGRRLQIAMTTVEDNILKIARECV